MSFNVPLEPNQVDKILCATWDERARQDKKWGQQDHPYFTQYPDDSLYYTPDYLYLETNYKRRNDEAVANGTVGWDTILLEEVFEAFSKAGEDDDAYEEELVQVMAVAAAMIEANRRKRNGQ